MWAHQCSRRFSGQNAYPEWMGSAFPALITGLPVIVALCYDQDLPDEIVQLYPEVYTEGINRLHFNPRVFVTWVLTALWHGSVAWLVPSLWVGNNSWTSHLGPEYAPVEFSFLMVITFINQRLWMYSYSPFALRTVLVMALSYFMLIACMLCLAFTPPGKAMQPHLATGVVDVIFSEWKYLKVIIVTPLFLFLDALALFCYATLRPSPLDIARGQWRRGLAKSPPKVVSYDGPGSTAAAS